MANVLKVSTPTGGYDRPGNLQSDPRLRDPRNIEAPVRPDKVVQPDARSDASWQNGSGPRFRFDTSFDQFVRQLGALPRAVEELPQIFRELQSDAEIVGQQTGLSGELARFLELIEMTPKDLQGFLRAQMTSSVRFTGAFFDLLRKALQETGSADARRNILDFLKRYTDMAESGLLLRNIQRQLRQIGERMFPEARERLEQMAQELLQEGDGTDQIPANAQRLKNGILPMVNEYIHQTHDRGELRNAAALLGEQISRYENGARQGVLEAFQRLLEQPVFGKYFGSMDASGLFEFLSRTEFETASRSNQAMSMLAQILEKGAAQQTDRALNSSCSQIMRSLLLNESVYMPLLHFMAPFRMDERTLFSEWWIDPDARGGASAGQGPPERLVKGLVKFDVQELGLFDLYFVWKESGKVTMQLNVPPSMTGESAGIRRTLEGILREHELETEELVVGVAAEPLTLAEAFPSLRERKNSIDVSV